jgi:hypothetical protein
LRLRQKILNRHAAIARSWQGKRNFFAACFSTGAQPVDILNDETVDIFVW